ncbi:MAG: hypothetical protein BWK79_08940 [Beggiatoa sp. IS2]|nr:MAG: hypothetical protein BWK79_08940 [Beggiatoa sp. IS2]
MFEIASLLLLGLVAGTLAGLLGVGGGVIIVPVLVWLFHDHPEIPTAHLMHMALATSLATIVFTAISSIRAHQQRQAILWSVVWQLTPGIIVGTVLGASVASFLSSDTLKTVFALFLLLIAGQLGFGAHPASHRQLPQWLGTTFTGLIIGKISALLGVGGGSLTVPFLVWCNVPMRHAVGTSAACGLPIAIAGTLGYIVMGWHNSPAWSTGYVYWPAVAAIVPTSLLFAPVGAKLAHSIPVTVLKRFFAVFLAIVSVKMLLS